MKRIYLTAIAASALALALAMPGVASANHHSRHDAKRARAHHRHHHHTRTVTFAAHAKTTTTTAPTTTKTEPLPGGGETAGTITSFEGGVLKITLNDGSVVSGKVTEQTEISCSSQQEEDNDADDNGGEEGSGDHSTSFAHVHGDDMSGGHSGDDNGDSGDQGDEHQSSEPASCGTAALVPGAKVQEAELKISSAGAIWEKVDLA
jgi:hypothetical protein